MTESEVLDIVKQMARRLCLMAYILEKDADAGIIDCLPTLIEDNHEDSQRLVDGYCTADSGLGSPQD